MFQYIDDPSIDEIAEASLSISFVHVQQALSKAVTNGEALPGDLLIAATGEVVSGKTGIELVPLRVVHDFKEWIPRTEGGGLVGTHASDSEIVKEAVAKSTKFGQYFVENGNSLIETFTLYGYAIDSGLVLSLAMTSSKISAYRKWAGSLRAFKINGARPPLFAHTVKLITERVESKRGTFFNVNLVPAMGTLEASLIDPTSELFERVTDVRNEIMKSA